MGLFGRSASDSLLPFYQNGKSKGPSVGASASFFGSRRGSRLCERCLILMFFTFFIAIFISTILYLPDISTKVHSVGKEFLIPERPVENDIAMQIKKPRHNFVIPADFTGASAPKKTLSRNKIQSELDGKLHDKGKDVEQTDQDGEKRSANNETEKRRQLIIKMMVHAWSNYVKYAWGANELRPVTKRGHNPSIFGKAKFGATIVDATDTLYMMGLRKEYQQAREWIAQNLNVSASEGEVSVFEFNIRYIGGLLSSYALTGDKMFLTKADEMATAVLPAFETPTGIPYAILDLKRKTMKNYGWASGGASILAEFGSLHLEFEYLAEMTGKSIYLEKVQRIRNHLQSIDKPKGLYPNYLNPQTGKWGQMHVSMGALGDSFYEYLFKTWIWSGKNDTQAKEMYDTAMEFVVKHLLQTSKSGLKYWGDWMTNRIEHKMDHLACFSGGLFGLSAKYAKDPDQYLTLGKEITRTCHETYTRTPTKLGPESFRFSDAAEAMATRANEKTYLLRPETFESYFILWRVTKDPMYREWGWEAAQAIESYCRAEYGYSGVKDVYQESPIPDDVQQSYFLAETLKYLFLLFSDDDALDLDKWVLNTEAHPIPVKRTTRFKNHP
ncbi:mannosyl-oligosaccharide alpha-1,2-mannosidase IA-like [Paramacrobiotus metropolitanus]|uniref:mannosyl-oligosaccharide alpha-1,2-mannosidase IA-like n=1 Tax=Paramacrobiotus metropolitanus TaxID=2943436 RepID=UPI002445BB4D|nr:mannosyl-oligosaccharide alpha-1,2-mannosidase IA-like [Paramacrobiotus metropolitanus]